MSRTSWVGFVLCGAVLGCGVLLGCRSRGLAEQGGLRLVYRMDLEPEDRARLPEIRAQEQRVLERRVAGALGVAQGTVQAKGEDQFVIELPGKTDADAVSAKLANSAGLEWYWAKNIQTERVMRVFRVDSVKDYRFKGAPAVVFYDQLRDKLLAPTDSAPGEKTEYQKIIDGWQLILRADDIARAEVLEVSGRRYIPRMIFTDSGARKIESWCRKYTNKGENMAAVLDGVCISIAPLREGAIISDQGVIDGNFDPKYVHDLVELLNTGPLPVNLILVSVDKVPAK